MTDTVDPSQYVHCPQLDVAGSLSLGKALLAAAPHGASAGVKRASHALHACVLALESAFHESGVQSSLESLRPLDLILDHRWAAVHDRLAAYATLDEASRTRPRALALAAELFPSGLGFLKLNYPSEHAESDKRLAIVGKHERELDALVGAEFLAALRAAHAAYGKALGITEAKADTRPTPNLREPLEALRTAVGKYAVQVLAYADDEHHAAAKKALAPIEAFRALAIAARSKVGTPGDVLPPGTPAPSSPTPAPPV